MLRMYRGLGGRSMSNLVLECRTQEPLGAESSNRDAAALAAGAYMCLQLRAYHQ